MVYTYLPGSFVLNKHQTLCQLPDQPVQSGERKIDRLETTH